uniref:GGDEF domain-containing protein n=1 Tax=Anisakis simplex TaxID=6269 RepID=A0A0M3K307_ANISI
LALIVYIDHGFVRFAINYSLISLLNLIAIICTIFALKDQNAAMLYPMLVSLVSFIFHLTNIHL